MNPQPLVPDTDPHRLAATIGGHNLIDGQLVRAASGRSFPVVNPATGREIAGAALSDSADVDSAVSAAARAQVAWAAMPARKRGALVTECARLLAEHVEELGRLVALETGKALRTESRVEASVLAELKAAVLARWDPEAIAAQVLASQARRKFINALPAESQPVWDYQAQVDDTQRFVRRGSARVIKVKKRWPPLASAT